MGPRELFAGGGLWNWSGWLKRTEALSCGWTEVVVSRASSGGGLGMSTLRKNGCWRFNGRADVD